VHALRVQQLQLNSVASLDTFNSLLLRLMTETTRCNDGELVVVEWRLEWRQYHIPVAAIRRRDESCVQGHRQHHRNTRCPRQLVCPRYLHLVHQDYWQGISDCMNVERTTCVLSDVVQFTVFYVCCEPVAAVWALFFSYYRTILVIGYSGLMIFLQFAVASS